MSKSLAYAADAFTQREFRNALSLFPTGVAVVTTEVEGIPLGATISSFNSVSLSPPLILFSLARTAYRHDLWQIANHFAVTILNDAEHEVSNRFARGGAEKWSTFPVKRSARQIPLPLGGVVQFECDAFATHEAGDHSIVVGRVLSFVRRDGEPLVFHRGRYSRLQVEQEIATPTDIDAWLHGW